jgi:hypothetical protein
VGTARPFFSLREKAGVILQLETLARDVPLDSILLFNYGAPEHSATTPLAFQWGRNVLPAIRLRRDVDGEGRRAVFEDQVLRWLRGHREVYYLSSDDGDAIFLARGLRWELISKPVLAYPTFGMNRTLPSSPQRRTVRLELLRASAAVDRPLPCTYTSWVAGDTLLGRAQGVYGAESNADGPFRWAAPGARVVVPTCDRIEARGPLFLRVRASCGRAPVSRECDIKVVVNDRPAGVLGLGRRMADYDLALPNAAFASTVAPLEIRFLRDVPLPRRNAPDRRSLSFRLGGLAIVRAGGGRD